MNNILKSIIKEANIFFVRHAQSEYNAHNIVAGRTENKLTQEGQEQAIQTGKWFNDKNISCIVHSPMERTKDTALLIKEQLSSQPTIKGLPSLIEIHAGMFEGKSLKDIEAKDPIAYQSFRKNSWEAVKNAERITSLLERAKHIWHEIVSLCNAGHTNIIAVSHGGFLQWIFRTSFAEAGAHTNTWTPVIRVQNCSIYHLKVFPITDKNEQHIGSYSTWHLLNYICYN